jgi:hypothetical protein
VINKINENQQVEAALRQTDCLVGWPNVVASLQALRMEFMRVTSKIVPEIDVELTGSRLRRRTEALSEDDAALRIRLSPPPNLDDFVGLGEKDREFVQHIHDQRSLGVEDKNRLVLGFAEFVEERLADEGSTLRVFGNGVEFTGPIRDPKTGKCFMDPHDIAHLFPRAFPR